MRDVNDFSAVRREGAWILGSTIAAVGLCYAAPEYGYSPVPFFSVLFYGVTTLLRFPRQAAFSFSNRSPQ